MSVQYYDVTYRMDGQLQYLTLKSRSITLASAREEALQELPLGANLVLVERAHSRPEGRR